MLTIRVLNCDNFAIDASNQITLAARERMWIARVSSDVTVHVKRMERDALRDGAVDFTDVATAGDEVLLSWQFGSTSFVFGDGLGGTVDVGASAEDSAQNLKAAIAAYALANNIDIEFADIVPTGVDMITQNPYVHIEEVTDTGAAIIVIDFDYTFPATADDPPFTEFKDLFFSLAEGEGLSFMGEEGSVEGICSVAEVKVSA